jgi:hypothetical protein
MPIEPVVIHNYKRNRSGRYIIRKQSPLDRFITFCHQVDDSTSPIKMILMIITVFSLICAIGILTTRTYVTGHGWVTDEKALSLYKISTK